MNTVKTHMRHVYDKLGVHRRHDAVEQARALGLLAPSRDGPNQGRALGSPWAARPPRAGPVHAVGDGTLVPWRGTRPPPRRTGCPTQITRPCDACSPSRA